MSSKMLCFWLRFATVAIALCGLYLCIFAYPFLASLSSLSILTGKTDIKLWAWLIFLWTVSIPCFVILVYVWKVSGAVKKETVFTMQTAKQIKTGAQILFVDIGILFIGAIVFTALRIIDLFIPIVFILVVAGLTLAVFASSLSRYVTKAAELKEESEGTI